MKQIIVHRTVAGPTGAAGTDRSCAGPTIKLGLDILYAVITRRVPYNEEQAFRQTPATQARRLHHLQKQAAQLGLHSRNLTRPLVIQEALRISGFPRAACQNRST